MVILNREFEGEKEGVLFRQVPLPHDRLGRMTAASQRFWRAAREIDAHLYQIHDPELLWAGKRLAGEGKQVVYDVHEDLPRQIMGKEWIPRILRPGAARLAGWEEQRLTRSFRCCLGATPEIAARFPQGEVFRNFPLPEQFPPGEELSRRPRQAAYLGSVTESRGLFEMLEAAKEARIPLVMAGRIESDTLLVRAKAHPGWEWVRWLGQRDRKELPGILAQCRMGLLLLRETDAYRRSMPIKLFEYLMAGVPVVASDFPFWRRLTGGKGCLFVPPGSPGQAARAMARLAEDPCLAQRLGEEGRQLALERFNGRREQQKLLSLWDRLAGDSPAEERKVQE